MTARSKDLAVIATIAILGVAVWIESAGWVPARNLSQDPTVLPRSIAVVLWLVAIGMIARISHDMLRERADGAVDDPDGSAESAAPSTAEVTDDGNLIGALAGIAAACVYAWVAFRLGWATTTWAFLVGSVALLGPSGWSPRRVAAVALVAAVATAIIWFGFVDVLRVRIPPTLLP